MAHAAAAVPAAEAEEAVPALLLIIMLLLLFMLAMIATVVVVIVLVIVIMVVVFVAALHRLRVRVQGHRHRRASGRIRLVHPAAEFHALPLLRRSLLPARRQCEVRAFFAQTRIDIEAGCGIDTTVHRERWKQVNILTEIACCEFPRVEAQPAAAPAPVVEQLSLFETPA
jgi:hypothetical protein